MFVWFKGNVIEWVIVIEWGSNSNSRGSNCNSWRSNSNSNSRGSNSNSNINRLS